MAAVFVTPIHDPSGVMFPHLFAITPQLQTLFDRTFLSITPSTQANHPQAVARLLADDFFDVFLPQDVLPVGTELTLLYRHAAAACPPETILHLCFIDRVAFALQSQYQPQFSADIQTLTPTQTPLIFQRSAAAWRTHPRNYRQLEQMVTATGQMLLGQSLDFAWCHLAVQAGELRAILPRVQRTDFSVCAELVLFLRATIQTRDVDWLAWEDPLILGRPARQLKREREQSVTEARKRLAYVLPMLQVLQAALS